MVDYKDKKILIVDDDHELRGVLSYLVSSTFPGVSIKEASGGNEAIKIIQEEKFDLLITDLKMPLGDGHFLIEQSSNISRAKRPKNILVVSGYIEEQDYKRKSVLPISYMSKPFSVTAMTQYLTNVLNDSLLPSDKEHINREIIVPMIESAEKVFKMLGEIDIQDKEITIKKENDLNGDISAIISIVSEQSQGNMGISFNKETYINILNHISDNETKDIDSINLFAAGEMINNIFSLSKVKFAKQGYNFKRGPASIITGKHGIIHSSGKDTVVAFLKTKLGNISLEMTL